MRVLLIADVHANWDALLALQRAESRPDAVLFAGDAVGYGPDPQNCVRWLLANATAAVRGNHDAAVLAAPAAVRSGSAASDVAANGHGAAGGLAELAEAADETLAYARRVLAPEDLSGLAGWPASALVPLGDTSFFVVHGTPDDPLRGRIDPATCPSAELERLFAGVPRGVIVLGHSHVPAIRRLGDWLLISPGSLGQPRWGAPDATYAVWEDGDVQIRHLHYDHDATIQKLRLAGLSGEAFDQLAAVLATGLC